MIALVIFAVCVISGFWTVFWEHVTIRKQRRINDPKTNETIQTIF